MRIYSMSLGFNMDIKDFTLFWDINDNNDINNNTYYLYIKNTDRCLDLLTKDEIWKINEIFNKEVYEALFGYVDFDDVVTQATGRKII